MRKIPAALLLVLLLLVAACQQDADQADDPVTGDEGQQDPTETADGDLPDGVAATVNGTQIPSDEVDNRLAAAEADGEFAAALEGEQGEMLVAQFRAQTLSVLVQTRIVLDSAEELDATPSDEDVEEARAGIIEEFGTEEEFEDAVAASGMSREALDEQLRGVAALDLVGRRLAEDGETAELPEGMEGMEGMDAEQIAVQQWLGERLAAAQVTVDPAYGQWVPEAGQVMPAGAMQGMPGQEAPPQE